MNTSARSVLALAGLALAAPVNLAVVVFAMATRTAPPRARRDGARHTVLISGGKMTKALQLARSFHAAGHRVVLVESAKYRWTGHRFSRAVDRFHVVPEPTAPDFAEVLLDVVQREGVDVYVPVSSPASSVPEADTRKLLDGLCEVVHVDPATVRMLDDKVEFAAFAASLGLRVPDSHRITDVRQIEEFDFPRDRSYILKRISYNPVGRMDLTPLTRETPERNVTFARGLGISADDPWVLQEFIAGREYCTHGTVRDGRLQVYGCCESSAFQINYAHVDKPEILDWHAYAIECNPRTHSAITMFYDHPDLAAAYLDDGHPMITPNLSARPTYWLYHELWRLVSRAGRLGRLRTLAGGKDAILTRWDPWPFFAVHHLQMPSLLWRNLRRGNGWTRMDFNIGKLVEKGGD